MEGEAFFVWFVGFSFCLLFFFVCFFTFHSDVAHLVSPFLLCQYIQINSVDNFDRKFNDLAKEILVIKSSKRG